MPRYVFTWEREEHKFCKHSPKEWVAATAEYKIGFCRHCNYIVHGR